MQRSAKEARLVGTGLTCGTVPSFKRAEATRPISCCGTSDTSRNETTTAATPPAR